MSKEKFETVLDYGSSKLRIGIIDKNFPKNKFFLDQKIVDDSRIDEFNFENAYKELANQNLNMRESGCLSLDLSYVGAGRLDGVWGYDVSLIDFAAGALIAQEGGALASNFNGDPKFLMENNIISATSKIYKSILKSIKPNFTN